MKASGRYSAAMLRTRLVFVGTALATIVVGLVVHWWGGALPKALRDFLGDALWAMMIYWWIGAGVPNGRLDRRALVALAVCWVVEVSQLFHTPMLDGWRQTTVGQLVLGSGFDPRDLGAYALGVLAAWSLELKARAGVSS
jgi:uncharacterized protein DUF2809